MKLLFDQNIYHRILNFLAEEYSFSSTVKQENLMNASDKEIWEYAKGNGYIIITQDADFNDLNSFYGFPPKIIWLRTGNLTTQAIARLLNDYQKEVKEFIENGKQGCLEILELKR
ncbi:MAG: DUF5615 family PIN-like protein, partial [Petrimonas sp.]|nr:DUF5615 family PIN-like protein [Petrimonas sp.]